MQKVKNLKSAIPLTPVQMIWLHSNRQFKNIEQNTRNDLNEIKFYKNNKGVEIRYQNASPDPDLNVIDEARLRLQKIIEQNQIKLLDAELNKELYLKISREVRNKFESSYIVFLHYETFENCAKKLKDKFGISVTEIQYQKLKNQNKNFCFLICQKGKMNEIYEYTHKLLNLDVSIASTTITRKINKVDIGGIGMGKRSLSVKSLKGSFTSGGDELEQRFSLNNSESDEEIYSTYSKLIDRLNKTAYEKILQTKVYYGRRIVTQTYHYPQFIDCKRRIYYSSRLQNLHSPFVQQVYAYYAQQNTLNAEWKLVMIMEGYDKTLRQQIIALKSMHHWKKKLLLLCRLGAALSSIQSSMQSQSQLNPDKVYIDYQGRLLISGSSSKQLPPYTCPIQYDNRLYFLIIYWAMTGIEIGYERMMKKLSSQQMMFTQSGQTEVKTNLEFLNLVNRQFSERIDLQRFVDQFRTFVNDNY